MTWSHNQSLLQFLMILASFSNNLVLFAGQQVVNDLLSSLFNCFRLVSDWFRQVLYNTYCFILAEKELDFAFAYQFYYKLVLNK